MTLMKQLITHLVEEEDFVRMSNVVLYEPTILPASVLSSQDQEIVAKE